MHSDIHEGYGAGMSVLSKRLREARGRLGLKQGELAQVLGVTQGTISRWESGDTDPDRVALLRVANLAGYDPTKFITEEEAVLALPQAWGREVPVIGEISEYKWLKNPIWDISSQFKFSVPDLPEWRKLELFGLVIGDSASEPYFSRQSIVIISKLKNVFSQLKLNDVVVVIRKNSEGLTNNLIREVYTGIKYDISLMPIGEPFDIDRSSFKIPLPENKNPAAQENTQYIYIEPDLVAGLVIGVFQIRYPRPMPGHFQDRNES